MTLFSDVAVRLIQTTCTDIIDGAENRNSSTTVKTANWAASLFNTSVVNTELSKEKCRLLENLRAEVSTIQSSFDEDDDKTRTILEDLITKYIEEVITATEMPSLTHSNEPLRGETEKKLEYLRTSLIDTKNRLAKLRLPIEKELLARSEFHKLIGLYYARRIYRGKIIPQETETPFFKAQKKLIQKTCSDYRKTIEDEDKKAIAIFGDEAKKHPYHQSKVNKDIECLVRKLEKEQLKLIETLKPSSLSGIIFNDSTADFARMLDTEACIAALETLNNQTTTEYVDNERADAMSTASSMSGQPYPQTVSTDELRRKLSALPFHVRHQFSRDSTSERPASVTSQKKQSAAITEPAEMIPVNNDHIKTNPTQEPIHIKNAVNNTEPTSPELPCILTEKAPLTQITSTEDAINPLSHEEVPVDNLELCSRPEQIPKTEKAPLTQITSAEDTIKPLSHEEVPIDNLELCSQPEQISKIVMVEESLMPHSQPDETALAEEEIKRDLALEPVSSTASMFQHLLATNDAIATNQTIEKPVLEVAHNEPPLLSKKELKKRKKAAAENVSNEAHAASTTLSLFN